MRSDTVCLCRLGVARNTYLGFGRVGIFVIYLWLYFGGELMRKTNKQLIKKLSPDSVGEAFLLMGIERYCNEILSDSIEWNKRSLINKDLWQVIAKHNLKLIEEHYK